MPICIVMGVSGSGKTTVAKKLAASLHCPFVEGDDLHPPSNVEKMRGGTPLTDADRLPWLAKIAEVIEGWRRRRESGVVTCSALKRSYRDILTGGHRDVTIVYLRGSQKLIHDRMAARKGHFMPTTLLDNQFATLEEPGSDEHAITVDIAGTPAEIAAEVERKLSSRANA